MTPKAAPDKATNARALRTKTLLEGPIAPTLLGLATANLPLMVGQAGAGVIEGWYIGQLGVGALASVALVYPILIMMQMCAAGAMGGAVNSAVARALGAGAPDRAANLVIHACLIALGGALLFMIPMLVFGREVVDFFGATDATRDEAIAYASVVFLGAPTVWLANTLASVVRGSGAMAISAAAIFGAFAIQMGLGSALTLGLGPFPQLGLRGAAFGHLFGFAAATLFLGFYVASGRVGLRIDFARIQLSISQFADILRVGVFALVSPLVNVATVMLITGIVARYGAEALAGYGLGARLEFLMVPIVFGIGTSLTAMVGANAGAGQWDRARRTALTGGLMAGAITGSIGIAVAVFPGLWLDMFVSDPAAREAGALYLRYAGPLYFFLGLGLATYFASLGAGRMKWPTISLGCRLAVVAGGGTLASAYGLEATFFAIGLGFVVLGYMNAWGILSGAWTAR